MGKYKPRNEGEGSQSGAREYNEKATEFAKSDKVDERAKEARKAIEGEEAEELRRAEEEGKRHMAEEDPEVSRCR